MARRDHHPAGSAEVPDAERESGCGSVVIGQSNIDARSSEDLGNRLREHPRSEARVVTDCNSASAVFMLQNVIGDGRGGAADIAKCVVLSDDAAPSVSSKFDWLHRIGKSPSSLDD